MAPEPQVVQISVEDWVAFTGILGRVETKLDRSLTDIEKHDRRIALLETWRWYTAGLVVAIGLVATIVSNVYRR